MNVMKGIEKLFLHDDAIWMRHASRMSVWTRMATPPFKLFWPCVLGLMVEMLGQWWFADRMVWLYEDMKDKDPEYQRWLY